MNHVIAKVRQRGKEAEKFKKVISDVTLFQLPENLKPCVPYTAGCVLEEDSWFGIENFSEKDFFPAFFNGDFLSTVVEKLKKEELDKMDYLVSIQNKNQYFFQKLSPSYLLRKKMITIGDVVEYREGRREIVIKEEADAIYLKEEDILYFRNLPPLDSIFKGISSLYREAGKEETEEFLKNDFITLGEDFSAEHVKQANRKRIAMAVDVMKKYDKKKKKLILDTMKDYCPDMVTPKGTFRIASENDLKLLLYGIDQRFYTTVDGEEKRIANSVIRLG